MKVKQLFVRTGVAVLVALPLSLGVVTPAHATAGRHVETVDTVYAGNWGTTDPLEVHASWVDKSESSCGGGVQYQLTEIMWFANVTSTRAYVTKIAVRYYVSSAKKYLYGGSLDIVNTSNQFHTTDFNYGAMSSGHWIQRTYTLNKWINWNNHSLLFEKVVVPSDQAYDPSNIVACQATYIGKFVYSP